MLPVDHFFRHALRLRRVAGVDQGIPIGVHHQPFELDGLELDAEVDGLTDPDADAPNHLVRVLTEQFGRHVVGAEREQSPHEGT